MARILQIRRGTTAQNDNFTGLMGELSFDTDTKTLRVHDGEKLGGYALARADAVTGGGNTSSGSGNNNGGTSGDDSTGGGCECAPGETSPAPSFDISSVPDEFWRELFERFSPSTGDGGCDCEPGTESSGDSTGSGGGFTILETPLAPIITTNPVLNFAFSSQETPYFAQVMLVCNKDDAGYTAGDVCTAFGVGDTNGLMTNTYTDEKSMHVLVFLGSGDLWVADKETAAHTTITTSKWRMKIRVYC